jgi:pilus assembly protein CpaC
MNGRDAFALYAAVSAAPAPALAQKTRPQARPADKDNDDKEKTKTLELNLAVGENKTIPATDVKNYSEGTPGIVDVKLTTDASQFVVVGLKPGSSSLLLIKKNGAEVNWVINVFSRSPDLVEAEVRQLVDGYTGIRVRRVGSRFFIEGGVSTEADVSRIKQIAALYPGQVESLVTLGGGLDRQTNIRIDFYFVQYDKSSGYQVGVSWPGRIGDSTSVQNNPASNFSASYDFVGKNATAQTQIVNQPLPALDIASRHGWAKVMKQATVITTNGIEAIVQNGGEQNFPISAGLTSSLAKIQFGTNVKVLPRFDPQTRDLQIKVDADVSDLIPPVTGTILPGRNTANLSMLVHLKLGQSLILSGIHTKNERHTVTGLPGLSELPVLGIFFGSHANDFDEVEGAVFIIPSIVEPSTKPAYDMVNEAMTQYEEYAGHIHGLDTYPKQPNLKNETKIDMGK